MCLVKKNPIFALCFRYFRRCKHKFARGLFVMKHLIYSILLLFCLLLWGGASGLARDRVNPFGISGGTADSIMDKVIFFAPYYAGIVDEYTAELYIKGRMNVKKKNHLIRFLPSMFRLRKGVQEYLIETYSDLHFSSPNIYDQKVKASVGTASEFWEADGRLLEYFHVNIYASSLLYDKLVSPLAPNAKKYYTYYIDSVWGAAHDRQFKIRFLPKNKSFQLVGGYMVVSDHVWSIREIRFSGRSELFRYENVLVMGEVGSADEFLPKRYRVGCTFRFLGNHIEGDYVAALKYREIRQKVPQEVPKKSSCSPYDLTESYTLRTDTNDYRRDTTFFNTLRPMPLTHHEQDLYQDFFLRRDTLLQPKKKRRKALEFWGEIGDALISRYTVDLHKLGSVRCSPLINPFLLSYSGSNGISYRQEFKYNRLFTGDRLLRIVPRIGYNFKQKEFYWRLHSDFDYWPEKRAALHIELGNGNRIYSSEMLDDLKQIPDSIFDFNQIHLDYFKDLYFRVRHSWEVVNGLTFDVGLSIHRRQEVKRSKFVFLPSYGPTVIGNGSAASGTTSAVAESGAARGGDGTSPDYGNNEGGYQPPFPGPGLDFMKRFRHVYSSFAPELRLTWTPGQYYYMNGDRKINLGSKYPTLSVAWERGLKHVLPGSGSYERWEVDCQYNLPLGLMRNLYLRAGWGAFTKQEELYFVDFDNLRRSNLPTGWNDDIGGVFQLLDGRWYNSSRKYLRGNVVYEAPFLLLHHLRKYTQYVLNERLYLNMLGVPHLKPYVELGYGIGTHVFDFGVFTSFANWKYQEIGVKFTFELFNR